MAKKKNKTRGSAPRRRKRRLQRWRNTFALIALLLAAATVFSGFRAFGGEAEATEAEETVTEAVPETTADGLPGTAIETPAETTETTPTESPKADDSDDKASAEATVLIETGLKIWPEPNEAGEELASCAQEDAVTLYPGTRYIDKNGSIWMQAKTAEDATGWMRVGQEELHLRTDENGDWTAEADEPKTIELYDPFDGDYTFFTDTDEVSCKIDMGDTGTAQAENGSNERYAAVILEEETNTYYTKVRYEYVELTGEYAGTLWEDFDEEPNAEPTEEAGSVTVYDMPDGEQTTVYHEAFHISYVQSEASVATVWGKTQDGWVNMDEVSMGIPNATVVVEKLNIRETPEVAEDNEVGRYSLDDKLTVDWDTLTSDEGGASRTWVQTSDDNWVCYMERGEDGRDNFYLNHYPEATLEEEEAAAESESNETPGTTETTDPSAVSSNSTEDDSKVLSRDGMEEVESTPNYWKIVFFVCVGLLAADLIAVVVLTMQIEKIETGGGGGVVPPPPPPPPSYPTIGHLSNQGKRPSQQDSLCVARTFGGTGILAAVADGMGGLSGGDKVSGRIVKDVQEFAPRIQPQDMDTVLPNLVNIISDDINKLLGPDGIYKSGSTLLLVLTDGNRFSWASVGDSRICLYREGVLNHVNQEHNQLTTEWMPKVQRGEMSMQQALSDPANGRKLTSFIGMGKLRYVSSSRASIALAPGDRIILMSDGVFNTLSDAKLAQLLGQYTDVQEAARQIEQSVLAADARGQDNFTAVILGF